MHKLHFLAAPILFAAALIPVNLLAYDPDPDTLAKAKQGNRDAMHEVACAYYEEDNDKAFKWAEKAANAGHPQAYTLLATMYRNGEGTEINNAKAIAFYKKAAATDDYYAMWNLALYCMGLREGCEIDYQQAIKYLKTPCDNSYSLAYPWLGCAYYDLWVDGDIEDKNKYAPLAIEYFKKAIDNPHPWNGPMDENTYIGEILAYSLDGYQYTDYPLAASHFTEAEENGTDGKAEYNLFLLYRDGLGVDMSYLNAAVKLNKALQKGNSLAIIENEYADKRYYQVFFNDFSDYTDESPAVADEEEDEELLRHDLLATIYKIAANDVVEFSRLYQLGECFLHGRGVTANEEEAFRWFDLAHKYNYGDAALALGKMTLGMRNKEAVHKYLDPIMNGTAELDPSSSALYQLRAYAKPMLSQIDEPNTCYFSFDYNSNDNTASLLNVTVTNPSCLFDLVIPEKTVHDGNEYSVASISRHAIGDDVNCSSIVLPSTLRSLGKEAIYRIDGLKSITLPASLEDLGWDSFRECFNLSEINVDPASQFFTSIDGNVYSKDGTTLYRIAPAKTAYEMPKDVRKVADGAAILTKLQTVKLNKSLTEIGEGAFAYCPELLAIEIPSSVKSLGTATFNGCEKLAEVKLPKDLIALPDNLFRGCQSLSHIEIPRPVATIGKNVFNDCVTLTSLKVDSKSPYIKSPDGKNLFSSDGKKLYYAMAAPTYEVPEGVVSIEAGALDGIESITIPASVKHIGEYQLGKCKQIHFMGKVEQLDDNYFDELEMTFYVPEGLQEHYRGLLQEYQRESVTILPLSAAKR